MSTPQHLHACSAPPELLRQTPPRLHDLTVKLQSFVPLCLHVCTPAAYLQTSTPPRPRARSMPHELQTSTPPLLHACSPLPELQSFIPLRHHICVLAARLHTSIPHLYTYNMPPELQISIPHTSTSLRQQRASSAPPLQAIKQELDHGQEGAGSGAGAGEPARKSWITGRSWGAGSRARDNG